MAGQSNLSVVNTVLVHPPKEIAAWLFNLSIIYRLGLEWAISLTMFLRTF